MTLETAREMRRDQAVRVASASRGARERELERYELVDALYDEIYWSEQMRQGVLPLDLSYQKESPLPLGLVCQPGEDDDFSEVPF